MTHEKVSMTFNFSVGGLLLVLSTTGLLTLFEFGFSTGGLLGFDSSAGLLVLFELAGLISRFVTCVGES